MSGIDPSGLMAFGGEFGKAVGSAINAASEGYMSQDGTVAVINAAKGPTYSPLFFSLGIDVGGSAYGITGGSVAVGILTGNGDKGLDICAYIMTCQGIGVGAAGGISLSGTATNAPPVSDSSYYGGGTTEIGFITNGTMSLLTELNKETDPTHIPATLGGGIGGREFNGVLTCQQYAKCIAN